MGLIAPGTMDIYRSLLTVTLSSLPIVAVYAYRTRLMNILLMAGLFVVSMAFVPATDYIFESVLKPHQQERILSYLGIVDKPQGDRLQRQPVENRHRLGRPLRQGVPARNADQIQLRARKTHRLHLLHRRRGGSFWAPSRCSASCACCCCG